MNVNVKNIPDELKARDRWVLWKAESWEGQGEKKPTKIPYSLRGKRARVNDPHTWGSFEQCYACYSKNSRYNGIGFVFSLEDDVIGIDLDHYRDAASGQISRPGRERSSPTRTATPKCLFQEQGFISF